MTEPLHPLYVAKLNRLMDKERLTPMERTLFLAFMCHMVINRKIEPSFINGEEP